MGFEDETAEVLAEVAAWLLLLPTPKNISPTVPRTIKPDFTIFIVFTFFPRDVLILEIYDTLLLKGKAAINFFSVNIRIHFHRIISGIFDWKYNSVMFAIRVIFQG